MRKNRYLICFLASCIMLFYSLPKLPLHEEGSGSIFAISWLMLCLFVIAGNLSALLFTQGKEKVPKKVTSMKRKRIRLYQ